jgi:DNA-binding MarR family transcriptional regulator
VDESPKRLLISLLVRSLPASNLGNVFLVNYNPGVSKDTVDTMLAQWKRERPDLDVAPTGVFGRIARIAALVEQSMDRVFEPYGLTGADFVVLAALRRSGKPYQLTPTALSRSMMVSSGGTTKRLDRLETRGLIRRDPDPTDRRGTLVTLTDTGRATIDTVEANNVQNEKRLLAPLPRNERTQLTRLLRELLLALEHE